MKQQLVYGALFSFALAAAAPMAIAHDHGDDRDPDKRSMDSGAYDAGDNSSADDRAPTDPRNPSNVDGAGGSGTGTGTGGSGGTGTGTGAGGAGG